MHELAPSMSNVPIGDYISVCEQSIKVLLTVVIETQTPQRCVIILQGAQFFAHI